jgi:hypothetical protein
MSVEAHELITKFREVVRAGKTARWTVTGLLLAVIFLNFLFVKGGFDDFRDNGWPEFATQLGQEFTYVQPEFSDQAAGMFRRVVETYGTELDKSVQNHKPALLAATQTEIDRLEAYANARWPDIQKGLAELIVREEQILYKTLNHILPEDEAQALGERYGEAMLSSLESLVETKLIKHADLAENIGRNLASMCVAPEQYEEDVDSRQIVAVALELAGINLQQSLQ